MDELVKRAIRKYRRDRKDLDTVASDKSYSDKIGPENYVILVNDELRPLSFTSMPLVRTGFSKCQ